MREQINQNELEIFLQQGKNIFENLNLCTLDFSNFKMSEIQFINCDLKNAVFKTEKEISDCIFKDCDISNAKFNNIMRCDFHNCKGFQSDFKNSEITESDFTLCEFEKADFQKSNMLQTSFNHCVVKNSNFRDSELFTVHAYNFTHIQDSYFDKSKISSCEFDDTMFYLDSINKADIKDSSFNKTSFVGSNLNESHFQDTSFRGFSTIISSDIHNAKFSDCDLYGANFYDANGVRLCEFTNCEISSTLDQLINPHLSDSRIENLRKELIKERSFYKAYALMELNEEIPVPDLPLKFMEEVVKEHGTTTLPLQKAVGSVAIRDNLSPAEMGKLMQDTLKTDEYKRAFEREQGQSKTSEYAQ